MARRSVSACRRCRRAAPWIAAAVFRAAASAQVVDATPQPNGFHAGPFVIAPSLTTGYSYNTNLFLNSRTLRPTPDQVLTLRPALQLTIPFSNSALKFGDTLNWVNYKQTEQTGGKTSNDAVADLILRFGSLDQLEMSARHVSGVAETRLFDEGQSVSSLDGNPYRLDVFGVAVSRDVEGVRGYRFSLTRNALRFDPSLTLQFFDYQGFDGEGAYVQPLSPNTRLAFGYLGSRYDQFSDEDTGESALNRIERGDTGYAQVEGRLGSKMPYSLRLGWEHLGFVSPTAEDAADFSGVIVDAKWSAIIGSGTTFTVAAQRQPYRSFFSTTTHYVFQQVEWRVVHPFPRGSEIGGGLGVSRSDYRGLSALPCLEPDPNDPANCLVATQSIYRRDRAIHIEAYANLIVADRVFFRLSVVKNVRHSNFPGGDYDGTVVFGGFIFGWL